LSGLIVKLPTALGLVILGKNCLGIDPVYENKLAFFSVNQHFFSTRKRSTILGDMVETAIKTTHDPRFNPIYGSNAIRANANTQFKGCVNFKILDM